MGCKRVPVSVVRHCTNIVASYIRAGESVEQALAHIRYWVSDATFQRVEEWFK